MRAPWLARALCVGCLGLLYTLERTKLCAPENIACHITSSHRPLTSPAGVSLGLLYTPTRHSHTCESIASLPARQADRGERAASVGRRRGGRQASRVYRTELEPRASRPGEQAGALVACYALCCSLCYSLCYSRVWPLPRTGGDSHLSAAARASPCPSPPQRRCCSSSAWACASSARQWRALAIGSRQPAAVLSPTPEP